jgi:hypothetical protein
VAGNFFCHPYRSRIPLQAALKEAGLYFAQGSGPDLNKLDDAWICDLEIQIDSN